MTYFSSSLQAGTDAKPVFFRQVLSDEISSEVALDTLAEIARNHFVARRVMLLRTAEKTARKGGAYSARQTEIDPDWPRLSGNNRG